MKSLLILCALIPLTSFAGLDAKAQKSLTLGNKCEIAGNSGDAEKDCILEEKETEAEENFKNFQENTHIDRSF